MNNKTFSSAVFAQIIGLSFITTWCMGGNIWWAKIPIYIVGAVGVILFPFLLCRFFQRGRSKNSLIISLIPLIFLNLYVAISLFNPSHRVIFLDNKAYLAIQDFLKYLPSCIRPQDSINALLLFDIFYISCFNILLIDSRRRYFRIFAAILIINSLVLAILGSLQKFVSSNGPYFGLIISPNSRYFSTFLYHNHWGPYAILSMALCLGYIWHHIRHPSQQYRDFWHSPAFLILIAVLILALSLPLCESRSCSLLSIVLLLISFSHWLFRTYREATLESLSGYSKLYFSIAIFVLVSSVIAWTAFPTFQDRIIQTREQLDTYRSKGTFDNRASLYGNVFKLIKDRPVFGWGMASFPYAFYNYNTGNNPFDARYTNLFVDAHSDALQCLSENGLVGSTIIATVMLAPLFLYCRLSKLGSFSSYLLLGCALVVFQSLFEFPFGCPAVVLSWWIAFFYSIAYPLLEN